MITLVMGDDGWPLRCDSGEGFLIERSDVCPALFYQQDVLCSNPLTTPFIYVLLGLESEFVVFQITITIDFLSHYEFPERSYSARQLEERHTVPERILEESPAILF